MEEDKSVLGEVASLVVLFEGPGQLWRRHVLCGIFSLMEEQTVKFVLGGGFFLVEEVEPAVCAPSAALVVVLPGLKLTCVEEMDAELEWKSVAHVVDEISEIDRKEVRTQFGPVSSMIAGRDDHTISGRGLHEELIGVLEEV